MKEAQVRVVGVLVLGVVVCFLGVQPARAQLKPAQGILSGVVDDAAGVPQMGASVEVIPESAVFKIAAPALSLFTNKRGVFRGDKLAPGFYTLRVTLAGFLPSLQTHVRINADFTTLVRIQLESMFATLEQLRRAPSPSATEADDWKWVLRSAASVRPVLEWTDPDPLSAVDLNEDSSPQAQPRARLEFTDGARRPGSVSNLPASPTTAFAYDQAIGGVSRLLLAGLMNADAVSPAGGISTVWLPTGSLEAGPHTALVLRESKLGEMGPTFRGVRVEQGGSIGFGNRAVLQYGGEYVLVGLGKPASSLRPHMELDARVSDNWQASLIFAAVPASPDSLEAAEGGPENTLSAALNELDAFPVLMWRAGRPVLESGFHEELAAVRKLGKQGKIQVAAFHQDNSHSAVFGRGNNLPVADFFQDVYADGFAYDGGSSNSWGTRVAYRQKLANGFEVTTVYAFAGALAPWANPAAQTLRETLRTEARQSAGAKVSRKVARTGTQVSVGYEWISGPTVTRVDSFGESLFGMDPYFHFGVHQRLPKFGPGQWEANAECDNLLAQGYITLNTPDGRVTLVPAFRTFRGGLSLQF